MVMRQLRMVVASSVAPALGPDGADLADAAECRHLLPIPTDTVPNAARVPVRQSARLAFVLVLFSQGIVTSWYPRMGIP